MNRLLRIALSLIALFVCGLLPAQQDTLDLAQEAIDSTGATAAADSSGDAQQAYRKHMDAYRRFYPDDLGTALYEARAALTKTDSTDIYHQAEAYEAIGRCLLARGDTLDAVGHLREAVDRFTALDDLNALAQVSITLGDVFSARRDSSDAISSFMLAYDAGRRVNNNAYATRAGAILVDLRIAAGDYQEALALIPEVRAAADAGQFKPQVSRLDHQLAELQWLGGMQQTALATAKAAVVYANGHGDLGSMHDSYTLLARFEEELAQPEDALRHYRLAWDLDRTALQQEQVRQLTVRDSLLRQREQRIESIEKLNADMRRGFENMQTETIEARQELKELAQTRNSAATLRANVKWLAFLLAIAVIVAVIGWLRYTRLRIGVLRESGK